MSWFNLNTGDEEKRIQLPNKYFYLLSDMYSKVKQNIIMKYFTEI